MQQELQGINNGTAHVAGPTYAPGQAASSHAASAVGLSPPTYAPGQAASSHAVPAMGSQTGGSTPPTYAPGQAATGSQTGDSTPPTDAPGQAASSHAVSAMASSPPSPRTSGSSAGSAVPGAASPAPGLQGNPSSYNNADMFAVCWSSPPTHAATPCGHMAYCQRRAQNFGPNGATRVCCMCRQYIQSMVPIFGAPAQLPAPTTPRRGTAQNAGSPTHTAGSPLPNFPVWIQGNARAIPIHLQ